MLIIGGDFHSGFQQVAIFDNQTGEIQEKKLLHPIDRQLKNQLQSLALEQGLQEGKKLWQTRL